MNETHPEPVVGFSAGERDYLRRERAAVKETIAFYDEHAPFRKDG